YGNFLTLTRGAFSAPLGKTNQAAAQTRGILCTLVRFHQMNELIEEIAGVVRTGRSLGMVLHAEERQRTVAHAFVGLVVQIQVREFDIARWQRLGIDAETMILRSDLDLL